MENKIGNFESPSITSFESEKSDSGIAPETEDNQNRKLETGTASTEDNTDIEWHTDQPKNDLNNPANANIKDDVDEATEECTEDDDDDKFKSDGEDEEKKKPVDEWEDVLGSGALLKKMLAEGIENRRPQRLDICTLNYTCSLENGDVVESGQNFTIQMGDLEVVQGIDVALALMNVGEKCLLKIEPRLAYGTKGLEKKIPPDTSVLYEIELLKCECEPEIDTFTIEERKKMGELKKKRGNWWYDRGECTFAIQCYRRALDYLDEVEGGISKPIPENDDPEQRAKNDAALQDLMEDRINVSNNMAAAQMKLGAYDAALQSLQIVLRCQPNNVKALYRKAKVLKAKNDVQEALKYLLKAQSLEPENTTIQKDLNDINALLKKHKTYEKELAKRMFNSSAKNESKTRKNEGSKKKSYMWTSIALSVAIGAAGIAAWRFKFS